MTKKEIETLKASRRGFVAFHLVAGKTTREVACLFAKQFGVTEQKARTLCVAYESDRKFWRKVEALADQPSENELVEMAHTILSGKANVLHRNARMRLKALLGPIVTAVVVFRLLCFTATAETSSWYGEELRGRLMANTRPFNPDAMTCASWFYPLGTKLRVTAGERSVVVTVTDRGPGKRLLGTRQIDLTRAAFAKLADPRQGLVAVKVEVVK